jgi:hypothetical protein
MKYRLRFLPEIEDDIISGYSWFEEKAPGLGEEFIRLFYVCVREIRKNALIYPKVYGEFRRCLTPIFTAALASATFSPSLLCKTAIPNCKYDA